MAGRPPGLRSLVRALGTFSPAQIRSIISQARRSPKSDEVERLERDRKKHLAAVKVLERKIAKLSGGNGQVATPVRKRRRRKMSAATRRKMSAAAKRRYAGKGKAEARAAGKKRRSMSPETRAKMAAAARKRWAKVKDKVTDQVEEKAL